MSNLKKHKKEWNLDLLYKNEEELDAHVRKIESGYKKFQKKYKDSEDWLSSQSKLFSALKDYESLIDLNAGRPMYYLHMSRDLNSLDEKIEAKYNKMSEHMTHLQNRLLFFGLALGKIPKKKQKEYMKGRLLKPFHYYLKQVFESSKYQLGEKEEQIINLWSIPAHSAWVDGVEKEQSKLTIDFEGRDIPLPEAFNLISELPTKKRRDVWEKSLNALTGISDFATHEINAIVTEKKIEDNLRGFKKSYSNTVLGYENDEKEVESLVKTVTDNFSISHRFYKLKKELMGLPDFKYIDKSAQIGKIKTSFSFDSQTKLFKEALQDFGPGYVDIFEAMLSEGRIDVSPKKGKTGGAYCICGSTSVPVFVLLNDVESFSSYRTLSHEMGHAFHGEFTKKYAAPFYASFPTSTAEVASTFFENIAFDRVFKELSQKEQVIALHDKVSSSIATIFRQIALFNFEVELHSIVREKGVISKEGITNLLNKHMRSYLGKHVSIEERDGLSFISWSHIRYFFYVYTYAYGELISSTMYEKYKEDPSYEEKIRTFLSSGGSASPKDIFKSIGLNITKPGFFLLGLKKIDKEIKQLSRLAKKAGMLS